MRWSRSHIPTLRDAPQDAEIISHQLMMRAGLIRKLGSGIYSLLPLGWKVVQKFSTIIREEMNAAGAEEVQLPVVQPKEIWEETGRWGLYGKELGRFIDRHEHEFCLQPTSEEAITDLVRRDVKSYRQLPLNLYQIQTKFRDEIRPRFGVMRGREFIMKDAYSFDLSQEDALKSYERMRQTYRRIFTRAGLNFRAVEADTGAIGGNRSEEFSVLAKSGEDELVVCTKCEYAANQEKAVSRWAQTDGVSGGSPEKFPTPGLKTIEDLSKSEGLEAERLLKTMVVTDERNAPILVLLRGHHQLHETKLKNALREAFGSEQGRVASDAELLGWKMPKGSLGPYATTTEVRVLVDDAVDLNATQVTGANEEGFHYRNLVLSRDVKSFKIGTVRSVIAGESCTRCGGSLEIVRGIEVGHVFYLGQKYSKAMKLEITDETSKLKTVEMGCYGIGVTRVVAAAIEQSHDGSGIIWPWHLAPYQVAVVSLGMGDAYRRAELFYQDLKARGFDVIWDDRDLSAGVKLKDVELVGMPLILIVGEKSLKEGLVEIRPRHQLEKQRVKVEEAMAFCEAYRSQEYSRMGDALKEMVAA